MPENPAKKGKIDLVQTIISITNYTIKLYRI